MLTPAHPARPARARRFEAALGAAGGRWRRDGRGRGVVYHASCRPFAPRGRAAAPRRARRATATPAPRRTRPRRADRVRARRAAPLDGVTLGRAAGPRLLRSMDVEVSADGVAFETVARAPPARRARRPALGERPPAIRDRPRPAGGARSAGRTVAAVRMTPVPRPTPGAGRGPAPPARATRRGPGTSGSIPHLGWPARRAALANPRPDREDWYYRGCSRTARADRLSAALAAGASALRRRGGTFSA